MYPQPTHQQNLQQNLPPNHSARVNGAGRGVINPSFSFHQAPPQIQHSQSMQHDHVTPGSNGQGPLSSFSGISGPFNSRPQNGHTSVSHAGAQLQGRTRDLYEEAQSAHSAMAGHGQSHYYARLLAQDNKDISDSTGGKKPADGESDADNQRPSDTKKRQDWVALDMSGQGLRNLVLQPIKHYGEFLVDLYLASNKLSRLPRDISVFRYLKRLNVSYNQLTEVPAELGMCTFLEELILFHNNIQELPVELGSLYKLEVLGIADNPIDPSLLHEAAGNPKNVINNFREDAPVPPEPKPRRPIVLQEDVSPSLERVKIFSWNILCDKYAAPSVYGYTPSKALKWEYRLECILKEIRYRDADFVALQEVSGGAFRDQLSPELAQNDYRGLFWPKTRVKILSEKDALQVDGCAVFYKQSKYVVLDKQGIEFASIAINRPDMKKSHEVFNRVMPKDNIALITFFESRETGARIILANVHLTWESTLADVKVVQTGILMEQITKMAEKYSTWAPVKDKRLIIAPGEEGSEPPPPQPEPGPSQEYRSNTEIPLVVCGDFNSTAKSSVFELMSKGRVPPDHEELSGHEYGSFTTDGIEHPFSLRDAYAATRGTANEMKFTNYTPAFTDVIDYIWYSTNTLEVVEVLSGVDQADVDRIPAFPNWWFPADHIQIMADFVIKGRKEKKQGNQDREHGISSSRRA